MTRSERGGEGERRGASSRHSGVATERPRRKRGEDDGLGHIRGREEQPEKPQRQRAVKAPATGPMALVVYFQNRVMADLPQHFVKMKGGASSGTGALLGTFRRLQDEDGYDEEQMRRIIDRFVTEVRLQRIVPSEGTPLYRALLYSIPDIAVRVLSARNNLSRVNHTNSRSEL